MGRYGLHLVVDQRVGFVSSNVVSDKECARLLCLAFRHQPTRRFGNKEEPSKLYEWEECLHERRYAPAPCRVLQGECGKGDPA